MCFRAGNPRHARAELAGNGRLTYSHSLAGWLSEVVDQLATLTQFIGVRYIPMVLFFVKRCPLTSLPTDMHRGEKMTQYMECTFNMSYV